MLASVCHFHFEVAPHLGVRLHFYSEITTMFCDKVNCYGHPDWGLTIPSICIYLLANFPKYFCGVNLTPCVFYSLTPAHHLLPFLSLFLKFFCETNSWLTFKLSFFSVSSRPNLFQFPWFQLFVFIFKSIIHRILFFSDYNRVWLLNTLMYLMWANKILPHFSFLIHVCLWISIFS